MNISRYILPSLLHLVAACGLVILNPVPVAASARLGRDKAFDSCVQVIVRTRFGTVRRCTGYVYSTAGKVVTPFHVVSDAESIQVFHADHGVVDVASIRRIDPRADIAVLNLTRADEVPFDNTRMADSRSLDAGDNVYIMHHPAYTDTVLYETQVEAVGYGRQFPANDFTQGFASEMMLVQLRGPFDVGSAGGIVCNDNFEVVAVLLAGSDDAEESTAYAIASSYLAPLLNSTYDVPWGSLRTAAATDADYFDKYWGPAPQPKEFASAMPEAYLAWFGPMRHVDYADGEFTFEINDKIDKNWFYTSSLEVDGRPLREWSASRIFIWPATINPWGIVDNPEQYVHFDADSLFSKLIYKNRDTEERIMTRYLFAMPLKTGMHTLQYENKGANYKSSGVKRLRLDLTPAQIRLLDIQGLSLVSMRLLPNSLPGVGEGEPVRYELERHPLLDKEINFGIRSARFELER